MVTTLLKPLDIVDWHIPTVSGEFKQVVMVVRVEDGEIWLTDGYSEIGYVPGETTYGELWPVPEIEADAHRTRISEAWRAYGKGNRETQHDVRETSHDDGPSAKSP